MLYLMAYEYLCLGKAERRQSCTSDGLKAKLRCRYVEKRMILGPELNFLYPREGIHRRWESATPDQATFILRIPRQKMMDETQETLRTCAFPSAHVKGLEEIFLREMALQRIIAYMDWTKEDNFNEIESIHGISIEDQEKNVIFLMEFKKYFGDGEETEDEKVMSMLKAKLMRLPKLWMLMAKVGPIPTDSTLCKTRNVEPYQDREGICGYRAMNVQLRAKGNDIKEDKPTLP
ncbi:hypothetical protein Tco_0889984 [Tanacetum coccineum]